MARPTLPTEVKVRRGTYRPGRDNPSLNGLCEGASRRLQVAKGLLDADSLAVYQEAVELIDSETPHVDGKHGMPDADTLADIEVIERAIDVFFDSIGLDDQARDILRLRSTDLYHMILDAQARAA